MRFATVRDLRSRPAQIRQALLKEKELVLTLNGKPFAILCLTTEETLEKSLAMMRRIRAENAVTVLQKRSWDLGNDRMGPGEVAAEIAAVRKGRRR